MGSAAGSFIGHMISSLLTPSAFFKKEFMEKKQSGRPRIYNDKDFAKMVKMKEAGFTYRQIAEKMGCHYQTLSYRFKKAGLTYKAKQRTPTYEDRRYKNHLDMR